MSKFDEVFKKTKVATGQVFYACLSCQHCEDEVDEAMYYPTESLLVWKCALGHKSWIEGFRIG